MILNLATGSRGAPYVQRVSAAGGDSVAIIFKESLRCFKDACGQPMLTGRAGDLGSTASYVPLGRGVTRGVSVVKLFDEIYHHRVTEGSTETPSNQSGPLP